MKAFKNMSYHKTIFIIALVSMIIALLGVCILGGATASPAKALNEAQPAAVVAAGTICRIPANAQFFGHSDPVRFPAVGQVLVDLDAITTGNANSSVTEVKTSFAMKPLTVLMWIKNTDLICPAPRVQRP